MMLILQIVLIVVGALIVLLGAACALVEADIRRRDRKFREFCDEYKREMGG